MIEHRQETFGMLDRARRAMQDRDWAEACRCWDVLHGAGGFCAQDYRDACTALRESGRLDEAEEFLEEGVQHFPNDQQIALAQGWLANERRDWPSALRRWEGLRFRFPENPWCYLGSLHALRGAGRSDEVDPLIVALDPLMAAARRQHRDPDSLLTLEIEAARATFNCAALRESVETSISGGAEPSPKALLALAQACWHMGDRNEADRAASRACAADPTLSEAEVIRAMVATERGDGEAALACYQRLAALNPVAPRWQVKVIQLQNRLGRVKGAISALEDLRRRWPNDPMVRMFLRNFGPAANDDIALPADAARLAEMPAETVEEYELNLLAQRAPATSEHRRPLAVLNSELDVAIARAPNACTAVLVFTGSNDAVSMPLAIFDRYLAVHEVTAVYMKDFNRLRFLRGIQSLGQDYSSTVAAMRETLIRLGVKRLCTVGNCDGGFAAIRYGVDLGAERIVTFCTPTFSPDESLTKIEQARNFMRRRLSEQIPAEMIDLRGFLEGRPYSSRIDLYYEENDPRDRLQAHHLAGLPGVTLKPQPGLSNHFLLRKLALSSDDFSALLGRLLDIYSEPAAEQSSLR